MKRLFFLFFSMMLMGQIFAHEAIKQSVAADLIRVDNVKTLLSSPFLTWQYREVIRKAFDRDDIDIIFDNAESWLRKNYPRAFKKRPFQSQQGDSYVNSPEFQKKMGDYFSNIRRARQLLAILRAPQATTEQVHYNAYKELMALNGTHPTFNFEDYMKFELMNHGCPYVLSAE